MLDLLHPKSSQLTYFSAQVCTEFVAPLLLTHKKKVFVIPFFFSFVFILIIFSVTFTLFPLSLLL